MSPTKLAGFKRNKKGQRVPVINRKIGGRFRKRILVHQRTFLKCRAQGVSRNKSIQMARDAEHRGMTPEQIQKYEGKLAMFSKYGKRKNYVLK